MKRLLIQNYQQFRSELLGQIKYFMSDKEYSKLLANYEQLEKQGVDSLNNYITLLDVLLNKVRYRK